MRRRPASTHDETLIDLDDDWTPPADRAQAADGVIGEALDPSGPLTVDDARDAALDAPPEFDQPTADEGRAGEHVVDDPDREEPA